MSIDEYLRKKKEEAERLRRLNLEGEEGVKKWIKRAEEKELKITGKEVPKPLVVGGSGGEKCG